MSLLVPFQSDEEWRRKDWAWLRRYWEAQLPDAEIVVGVDRKSRQRPWRRHQPTYSKAAAVNNAFRGSHGDVLVIVDADAYLDADVVTHCVERLRAARRAGCRTWFVPYRWLYRLTKEATELLLDFDPASPKRFPTPPPLGDWDPVAGDGHKYGHEYGAMCQIMPREAFVAAGGMDPRFRGWGGEDVSFLKALDVLWGRHKNTPNQILHLWHPRFEDPEAAKRGSTVIRRWPRQENTNDHLADQYYAAHTAFVDTGRKRRMQQVVDDHRKKRGL